MTLQKKEIASIGRYSKRVPEKSYIFVLLEEAVFLIILLFYFEWVVQLYSNSRTLSKKKKFIDGTYDGFQGNMDG